MQGPTISMDSVIKPDEPHWERSINSVFAEGVVAEYLHSLDAKTRWTGGNSPLVDARGHGMAIDAKVAFRMDVHLSSGYHADALGFMGSKREVEARDGVTHYGLVEVDVPGRFVRRGTEYVYIAVGSARLFLVPAADINEKFERRWRQDGRPGVGANRYLPADEAAQYEVALGEAG